jgi:pentapeptide repeat protein
VIDKLEEIARFVFGPPADHRARFYTRRAVLGGVALAALLGLLPLCFEDQSYAREVTLGALAGAVSLVAVQAAATQMRRSAWTRWVEEAEPAIPAVDKMEKSERPVDLPDSILYGETEPRLGEERGAPAPWPVRGAKLPLARVNMSSTNLAFVRLPAVDLSEALLREADLRGAMLAGAILKGADLRGADLEEADLRGVDLRDADLRGCSFEGALIDWRTEAPEGVDLRSLGAIIEGS